ncbi:MAG: hypothetical protein Kow0059_19350 [Candidatus Sumerlaeia bacterium]
MTFLSHLDDDPTCTPRPAAPAPCAVADGRPASDSVPVASAPGGAAAAALLAAVIAAFYWPAVVRGEFLADDWWFVSHYSLRRWLATFKGDWLFGTWGWGAYYRPLVAGAMYLDDCLWGIFHPGGWHLTNLALHWANAWLLFAVARRLIRPDLWPAALAGALLFALHPRFPEAVYWISGRTVLLAMTFILATALLFLTEEEAWWIENERLRPAGGGSQEGPLSSGAAPEARTTARWKRCRWSWLTSILACLSSETALTIPPIVTVLMIFGAGRSTPGGRDAGALLRPSNQRRRPSALDDWTTDLRALRRSWPGALSRLAPYYLIAAVYFVWRWAALGGPGGYPEQKAGLLSLRAVLIPLAQYPYALAAPARYHVPDDLFYPVAVWTAAVAVAALLWRRRLPPALSAGVWWMLAALAPYVNLALTDYERGRFLYPAGAGFFLAAAGLGEAAWRGLAEPARRLVRVLIPGAALIIAAVFGPLLREQVGYWDQASATSRRLIQSVFEWFPVPPPDKPMIFAQDNMNPVEKTPLHAIRGALLYPTPMLPTPFGKLYGAKGTPLGWWGWGMIPEGAPPPGSPMLIVHYGSRLTIAPYECGPSSVHTWTADQIQREWAATDGGRSWRQPDEFPEGRNWVTLDITLQSPVDGAVAISWTRAGREGRPPRPAGVLWPVPATASAERRRIPLGLFEGGERLTISPLPSDAPLQASEISLMLTPLRPHSPAVSGSTNRPDVSFSSEGGSFR